MVATTVLQIDDDRQFEPGGLNEAVLEKWRKLNNNPIVKNIHDKFHRTLDKAVTEKLKKRTSDETDACCIERKHFVADNVNNAVM